MSNKTLFVVGLILFLGLGSSALAHEDASGASIDLGVGNPLILPANPLYFFKELGRDVRRLFTFNKEAKALLELEILNKKAAEIKSLEEKEKTEDVVKAIQKYKKSALSLAGRVSSLKQSEAVKYEKLVGLLTDKLLRHHELFVEILSHNEDFKKEIEDTRIVLDKVSVAMVVNFENPNDFKKIFEEAVANYKDGTLKEFNAVHVLDRIEDQLPEEVRDKIVSLKDDLILRFEGRFRAESNEDFIKVLDELTINNLEELKVFDEVREKISDSGLKSKMNLVRQKAFLAAEENALTDQRAAAEIIGAAEASVLELEGKVAASGAETQKSVRNLLEKADFHFEQAKKFFDGGEYGSAFGQATAALAEAENGLDQLGKGSEDLSSENLDLRKEFDELKARAKAENLTPDVVPDLYELFDEAEKQVLEAKAVESLRAVKILLAEIEAKIRAREN
ncbi:MAG: hypothetical protein UY26_C0002G0034 [Candidatus Jorgensenbacteria bacterium GW2011_GWA1_48_13]|uniref:DUF5667 domain-containing protein n=2 Tax=Candidatus Joergenseniibacteriota TaxID=1752739 RepID=A0A0G1W9K1_9BACT|nr:MAG: hypothetical protein UY26_C0002G0034 [Candidatus Jorgensenbacteria bacterium GW2011_GWA1_48_13]KKU99115.1 MAG: hypothetical protein UY32_C0006G0031 [Candidatus Jorgensenbacteria bacterium GW2011_GWC1_48_8]KKW15476.1 MAG: hypothetical protein UY55_C0001G0230 [Candidatus Jorgensenbacteria bacterium GW2011_GWB1_50_10]